jgi:hypothetical protein
MAKTALNITQTGYLLLNYKDLFRTERQIPARHDVEDEDIEPISVDACDLYMICTKDKVRLRYSILPYAIANGAIIVYLIISSKNGHAQKKISLDISDQLVKFRKPVIVHQNEDRNGIVFRHPDGIYEVSLHCFQEQLNSILHDESNQLYIEYIGQSQRGHKGNGSSIADRLANHEKMLKIAMDINLNEEHREIVLVLIRLEFQHWNTFMLGNVGQFQAGYDLDFDKFENIQKSLPKDEIVNLAEAVLINSFKPRYNEKFSKNLVTNGLKVLNRVRKMKYSGISYELNIKNSGYVVGSDVVAPSFEHFLSRDIESKKNDREFFKV